jgi:hypothetical protein
VPGVLMTAAMSDLLVAIIKLAAVQVRFGLVAMEVAALSIGRTVDRSDIEIDKPAQPSIDAEIDAAARAIKAKLIGRRDGGFRNMLQLNFPDDEIRVMAEAALTAARRVK